MCFIVKVLPWIHSAAAKSEMTHDAFRHLFSDDWVYCQLNSECVSGQCEGGICLQSLTHSNLEKLGPVPDAKRVKRSRVMMARSAWCLLAIGMVMPAGVLSQQWK